MRYFIFLALLMFLGLQSANIHPYSNNSDELYASNEPFFNLKAFALGFGANLVIPEDVVLNKGVNYTMAGLLSIGPLVFLLCLLMETTVYRNMYSYEEKINTFIDLVDISWKSLMRFLYYTAGKEAGQYCHKNLKKYICAKLKGANIVKGNERQFQV